MPELTTGRLAEAASVNPQTLRYYERRGLLSKPARSTGNYRLFDQADVQRVRFIKRAQSMGFSLAEVGELLALGMDASADCGDVREKAQAHLASIERKIRDLRAIQATLSELIDGCPGTGSLSDCPILRDFMGASA